MRANKQSFIIGVLLLLVVFLHGLLHAEDFYLSVVKRPGQAPVVTAHNVGPGYVHVAYSNDLKTWTGFAIALNVFGATNSYTWHDYYASNAPARFYRAAYEYRKPVFP